MAQTHAPLSVSFAVYAPTVLAVLSSGACLASCGYYTPWHTNAFSVAAGTLAQVLMVVGCGGLTGLRYANFSVLPSLTKQLGKPTRA